ncbi:MAG: hypothetical protein QXK26_01785, partial [Candidatus Bathyarchaeia archaeon]
MTARKGSSRKSKGKGGRRKRRETKVKAVEEAKVGVFLSDCGGQIAKILDFEALTNFVKTIPEVALVARGSEFWRGEGLKKIVEEIERKKIDGVVVAETIAKIREIGIG